LTYGFRFNATTGAFDYTTNGSSFTSIATGLTSGPYFFYVSTAASTTASLNAGQRSFSYTAPTGFVALNTYNLATPTIANGAAYMAATTYTGTGATQSIVNTVNSVSFQPDWVWLKQRSANTYDHNLYDSVRGVNKALFSNTSAAEVTYTDRLMSFDSGGFGLGVGAATNASTVTYVGWQWKAGTTSSSNTSGSITSTVSAGATQGFSVVTYTGTGANATVGHGLGVAPSMVIIKNRVDGGRDWQVYHVGLTSAAYSIQLDLTAAQGLNATQFNSTAPTSSVFSIGTAIATNGSTNTFVAYCFAPVAGYSAFGTYTGNGAADGPFVYLGFRPRWLMVKASAGTSAATSNWLMLDTSRSTYNLTDNKLAANLIDAENSATIGTAGQNSYDFLSNGFKARTTNASSNESGTTYIYAAFAENPFKYSLAR
jgi:hypothetical protein